jgi:hypothetical protein
MMTRTTVGSAVQVLGAGAAGTGLYLLAGLAWMLLAVGLAVLAVGVLVETGRL